MRAGVAYFGNRILRHVQADMNELANSGFTGVLHTFSENDMSYYQETMARIVAVSHEAGLVVQMSPWGVAGVFGGEAESGFTGLHPELCQVLDDGRRVPAGCLSQPAVRAFVRAWIDAALETGTDYLFWDEPHWADLTWFELPEERWACHCDRCREAFRERFGADLPTQLTAEVRAFRHEVLNDFLADLVAHTAQHGGRSTVCPLPPESAKVADADWEKLAALPGLDILATDPYWKRVGQPAEPYVSAFSRHVKQQADRHGRSAQIWIQGFGLGPEDEGDVRQAVGAAREAGIEDLWTWGFEACGHMSFLETREPDRVWAILVDALTSPTRTVSP